MDDAGITDTVRLHRQATKIAEQEALIEQLTKDVDDAEAHGCRHMLQGDLLRKRITELEELAATCLDVFNDRPLNEPDDIDRVAAALALTLGEPT